MPWWLQQVHLEGMTEDEDIPFRMVEGSGAEGLTPGMQGPTIRENVDAGVKVIDLAKMKEELEELRRKDLEKLRRPAS